MSAASRIPLLRLFSLFILSGTLSVSAAAAPRQDAAAAAARAWETGSRTRPLVDGDGALRYPFGSYQPTVTGRPLHVVDVEMQPGESVQETACGDTKRWLLSVIHRNPDHVIIKPTDTGLVTNLIIITDKRTYNLRLVSRDKSYVPRIGFYYPQEVVTSWGRAESRETRARPLVSAEKLNFNYVVEGPESIRPVRVFDDGAHVYIEMPAGMRSGDAPAVFVTGADGNDALVNYRLSGKYYVIDKLFDKASLVLGVGSDAQRVTINKGKSGKSWFEPGTVAHDGFDR